jgi:hypothetical protein
MKGAAMSGTTPQPADGGSDAILYVDPDGVTVVRGEIVPGANIARAALNSLIADLASDPTLQQEWKTDPKAVLGARGFCSDLQTSILQGSGIGTPESCILTNVAIGSFCCQSVAINVS